MHVRVWLLHVRVRLLHKLVWLVHWRGMLLMLLQLLHYNLLLWS
jgi:hypothetical protein